MKAYICDICGAVVDYVLEISAKPRILDSYSDWSAGNIPGQYCAKCAALVNDAIYDMLPEHKKNEMANAAIHKIQPRYYIRKGVTDV